MPPMPWPRSSRNLPTISAPIDRALHQDLFHYPGQYRPQGRPLVLPQAQDPDMSLHVVRETDAGIIVRGAKFETAALYANLAYVKPTITNWGDAAHRLRHRLCLRPERGGAEISSAARALRRPGPSVTIRCPTALTRSRRWSSLTMCWPCGKTCSFCAAPAARQPSRPPPRRRKLPAVDSPVDAPAAESPPESPRETAAETGTETLGNLVKTRKRPIRDAVEKVSTAIGSALKGSKAGETADATADKAEADSAS